jgi:hypothetical protein
MKKIYCNVLLVLSFILAGCGGHDSTTSAQFAASATPAAPGLVQLAQASASGSQVVIDVLLHGPEPGLDLNGFRFAIKISDPSVIRFVPQTTYVQSALVAADRQTISVDVDSADQSLVRVNIEKEGGGAGNGFTSPAVVVIELTFVVVGPGVSTLSFADAAQAIDSTRLPIEGVRFDTQVAAVTGIVTGGGGY